MTHWLLARTTKTPENQLADASRSYCQCYSGRIATFPKFLPQPLICQLSARGMLIGMQLMHHFPEGSHEQPGSTGRQVGMQIFTMLCHKSPVPVLKTTLAVQAPPVELALLHLCCLLPASIAVLLPLDIHWQPLIRWTLPSTLLTSLFMQACLAENLDGMIDQRWPEHHKACWPFANDTYTLFKDSKTFMTIPTQHVAAL